MKFSIITINFNNNEGLKKTIDSVISQTFTDYEYLIIDGGSTDGSRELIEQHQDHFAYWCSEPDNGVYNAMNKGIKIAKGEYIIFMNSGDIFADKNTLQIVFENLHQDTDILYGYMMRKTSDGMPHNKPSMKQNLYWEDFFFDTLPHQSSYIKRTLFNIVGMYNETYKRLADWEWFTKAFNIYNVKITFLPQKLSIYECGGISEDEHWKDELERIRREQYPSCTINNMVMLRDIHRIKEYWILAKLYSLINVIAQRWSKYKRNQNFKKVRLN